VRPEYPSVLLLPFYSNCATVELCICLYALESSFEFADVRIDVFCDKESDSFVQYISAQIGFLEKNGNPHLQLGRFDGNSQSPTETRYKAAVQTGDLFGKSIAGHDHLLVGIDQCVECVKEFFLGLLLSGKELDVVNQQDVEGMVVLFEFLKLVRLVSAHYVRDIALRMHVADLSLRVVQFDLVAYGLDQVSLAETDAAINEQGLYEAPGNSAT